MWQGGNGSGKIHCKITMEIFVEPIPVSTEGKSMPDIVIVLVKYSVELLI